MKLPILATSVFLFACNLAVCAPPASAWPAVVCPADAPARVKLAAKEIRRYVYLRTGTLLPIAETGKGIMLRIDPALETQQYRLKTDDETLTISGGSDVGVLYGAYRYVELLGARFQIDGDVVPDERLTALPVVKDETGKPLFELRGLQPFHDFPEGPDWWTTDDWKAVLSQATKMRMNFVGLHTYPIGKDPGAEPTVWVGLPEDVNADGTVKVSDPTSWYTTARFQAYGCYSPEKTDNYRFGAAEIFPSDNYGPEVNAADDFPMPKTPAASVALINRTGAMLNTVFAEAHRLGMKTCVGTESPLAIPDTAKARLQEMGMKPDDPATLQRLYEGMFTCASNGRIRSTTIGSGGTKARLTRSGSSRMCNPPTRPCRKQTPPSAWVYAAGAGRRATSRRWTKRSRRTSPSAPSICPLAMRRSQRISNGLRAGKSGRFRGLKTTAR